MKNMSNWFSLQVLREVIAPVVLIPAAIGLVATKLLMIADARDAEDAKRRYAAAIVKCPSILSIARDGRDTLIVMKYDSVCNQFVLDSLK